MINNRFISIMLALSLTFTIAFPISGCKKDFASEHHLSAKEAATKQTNTVEKSSSSSIVKSDTTTAMDHEAPSLIANFIDVGQADSILIQMPSGDTMLIDAGNVADGDVIVNYLKSQGVKKIDILVATHPHEDHIGGMVAVLGAFAVGRVWDSGYNHGSKTQQVFLETVKNKNLQYGKPKRGYTRDIGQVHIAVLAPGPTFITGTDSDANNNSLVLRITFGEVSMLFTGDMEKEERATIDKWPKSNVLKVAHHGSKNGTDTDFSNAVSPIYAIISYGLDNPYGHPHSEAVNALSEAGSQIYSTGQQGTIIVSTNGKTVNIKSLGKSKPDNTTTVSPTNPNPSSADDTVYLTRTGECYHRNGCASLRKSCIPISRTDAIKDGYRPCQRCRP